MTELNNKLLEISQELGLAGMNNDITPKVAIKINKKINKAVNYIPCWLTL